MAELATLQTWLLEAQLARHKLATGAQSMQVEHGDMRVSFTKADLPNLDRYIEQLRTEIYAAGGDPGGQKRKAISVDLPGTY